MTIRRFLIPASFTPICVLFFGLKATFWFHFPRVFMQAEITRLDALLASSKDDGTPVSVCVVGGSYSGVELAVNLAKRLNRSSSFSSSTSSNSGTSSSSGAKKRAQVTLLHSRPQLLPFSGEPARRRAEAALAKAGVRVQRNVRVQAVGPDAVHVGAIDGAVSTRAIKKGRKLECRVYTLLTCAERCLRCSLFVHSVFSLSFCCSTCVWLLFRIFIFVFLSLFSCITLCRFARKKSLQRIWWCGQPAASQRWEHSLSRL